MRNSHLLLALASAWALSACAADDAATPTTGTSSTTGADVQILGDTAGSDTAQAAPDVKGLAKVYLHDPITDNNVTSQVPLQYLTDPEGKLTGQYAEVRNCLQEDGGAAMKRGGFTMGNLCVEQQTVVPGADGSYLQYEPPADSAEPGDAFAELMMYYHVNQIHDYFADQLGLHALDGKPLYSLVNVTFNSKFGGGGWQGFPNAAFMPKEAFAQFGLPARDEGAIVFGQYDQTDFSYDASVIYHEYTHAIVGTTRLTGVLIDTYGLDNLTGAMNEGFADYFSCSLREQSSIGPYALTFAGEHLQRDLAKPRKCPDDLTSEVHADGKIIGSALWSLRTALGRELVDPVILAALQQFSMQTNLEAASKLILKEAKLQVPDRAKEVEKILNDHGMLGCARAKQWQDWYYNNTEDKLPYSFEGTDATAQGSFMKFPDGVPGYLQFYVDVPADAKGVQLAWQAQGEGFGMSAPKLNLAIKSVKPVVLNMMDGGSVAADAKLTVKADPANAAGQKVTLSGKCIQPGKRMYLMLLNKGSRASVTNTSVKFLTDTAGAANLTACE